MTEPLENWDAQYTKTLVEPVSRCFDAIHDMVFEHFAHNGWDAITQAHKVAEMSDAIAMAVCLTQ